MPLPDVVFEMVEFDAPFMFFDQLPITLAEDRSGKAALIAIVRIMPIERVAVDGSASEDRHEARTIDVLPRS